MHAIPDDQPLKQLPDVQVGDEANPDEPPPYSPPAETITSGSDTSFQASTFKTRPTNYLALSNKHDSIHGEFVIDPSICIPESVLPPLGTDETEDDRKNLSLCSRNGSVHANIWLLPSTKRRTTVALASSHGSIHAQIHMVNGGSFVLTATAPHESVKLALPRGFTGLLVLGTRHGSVKLSEALLEHATQLGQVGDNRRYFIGDFGLLTDEWEGDQVEAESEHGSVKLRYVDEGQKLKQNTNGKTKVEGQGLFSRLFGK